MANEANPCPCDIGDKFEYGSLGEEVQVDHIKAYIVKPKGNADKAVIVIQDIYGWQLPNTRYVADMLAANGYIAICPDFFVGKEPWKPSNDWSTFQEWLKDHQATNTNKEADVVLKYLKEHCNAKRIGVVGFCWGGAVTYHMMLKYPELKAGISVYGELIPECKTSSQNRKMLLGLFSVCCLHQLPCPHCISRNALQLSFEQILNYLHQQPSLAMSFT
nr:PREDICTED: carboxymethylenebutenolidase homolog [Latimeria chalumnae]|eukprot:XP_014339517.1 PREDICTED: carboxymethylenebutenolidase homolog [Latimeria chalumnae]